MAVKVGVVGYGYWGPNLVRNILSIKDFKLSHICDLKKENLQNIENLYPSIITTTSADDIIYNKEIDAVIIATPPNTHYLLAKKALENKKHVFVEKPITNKSSEALELISIAKKNDLILMTGHTFIYSGAVKKMKELIDKGDIGEVLHIHSSRLNLGAFQKDNVVWDLMPHDLSMILYLFNGAMPKKVVAAGLSHFNTGVEDTASATLIFSGNKSANIHVSWLDPCKVRNFTVIGSKKMIVYDETNPVEKIKVFDKGIQNNYNYKEVRASYRYGDTYIPKIDETEALKTEMLHFHECITQHKKPLSDGEEGYKVVKVIEMMQESIMHVNQYYEEMKNGK
jgi:predicted dehydrogenase